MDQQFEVATIRELESPAKALKDLLKPGDVVCFRGEMGAGKTTFIKVLLREMGVKEEVDSPTFALVNEYYLPDGTPVFHFDFYRVEKLEEALDIGFEEYLYRDAICLIEWPDVVEEVLPEERVEVEIEDAGSSRRIRFNK